MNNAEPASVQERWREFPLEWDKERVADTPRTVRRNWAAMTSRMRETVRAYAAKHGLVTLVDVGCGNGGFADGLDDVLRLYVGVDPSALMLKQSHAASRRRYSLGVGEELPLRSGAVDVVVIKSVLMHCFDPEQVLRESARVLREGGMLLVSVSNGGAWYRWFAQMAGAYRLQYHLFVFDQAQLRRLVRSAGLAVRECVTLGYFVAPRLLERWMPPAWIERVGAFADALGRHLIPYAGGVLILSAEKCEASVE